MLCCSLAMERFLCHNKPNSCSIGKNKNKNKSILIFSIQSQNASIVQTVAECSTPPYVNWTVTLTQTSLVWWGWFPSDGSSWYSCAKVQLLAEGDFICTGDGACSPDPKFPGFASSGKTGGYCDKSTGKFNQV